MTLQIYFWLGFGVERKARNKIRINITNNPIPPTILTVGDSLCQNFDMDDDELGDGAGG